MISKSTFAEKAKGNALRSDAPPDLSDLSDTAASDLSDRFLRPIYRTLNMYVVYSNLLSLSHAQFREKNFTPYFCGVNDG